jgi:chromate reductase, NAD(P)H dehydrogenase (quinone)
MAHDNLVNVLGIAGSLRKGSYNALALKAARELQPEGLAIETADISAIPPYNEDVRQAGNPPSVETFRAQIAACSAILFVTPEYNYSISGVLKNAIDWGSRPPNQPFEGKPVAIMGASTSLLGTARAQYHLRQVCVFLDMHPINRPEVMISQAAAKFDANGALTDPVARDLIGKLLVALRDWTRRLQKS